MRQIALALPALAIAAACTETEAIEFRSEQERACYLRASAALDDDERLVRDSNGVFVKVESESGFVRDVEPSPEFDQCMVAEEVPGSGGDLGTITFSPEEQQIWDSLTDAARKEALEFIRKGGTLKEFRRAGLTPRGRKTGKRVW